MDDCRHTAERMVRRVARHSRAQHVPQNVAKSLPQSILCLPLRFVLRFFFIVAKFVTGQIEVKSLTLNAAHAGHIHWKGRGDGHRSSMTKLIA